MRFRELSETPIADLDHRVDRVLRPPMRGKGGGFSTADQGVLHSDKGRAKIFRAFEKTPFVFNFYFMVTHDRPKTVEDAERILGRKIETDGRITIIYSDNIRVGHNGMPVSPWTVAHKIAHNLQANRVTDAQRYEVVFWEGVIEIAKSMTTIENPRCSPTQLLGMIEPEGPMVALAQSVMTQKSARERNINVSLDVGGELLAQYLLTGRVRFNRSAVIAEHLRGGTGNPLSTGKTSDYYNNRSVSLVQYYHEKDIDAFIGAWEKACNAAIELSLSALVGRTVIF